MTNGDKGRSSGPEDDALKKGREPERYPQVRQDDAVEPETAPAPERRSFDPTKDTPPAADEGRLGPGGDPAEGKP
jgi:hypothetical protein